MKNAKKKGFTIVELVIVIAVIAILAAVMIPTFTNVVDKANESKAMQEARNAYTVWLATGTNAQGDFSTYDFWIKSGAYYFEVENGQFKSATGTTTQPDGSPTIKNVSNGTLS